MATRSRIAIEHKDGIVDSIYCHWDGYPEGNGVILREHYQDRKKVEDLIGLGSLSYLQAEVHPTGPHSFEKPQTGVTVAYHRDRGEPKCSRAEGQFLSREEFLLSDVDDYGYLFTKENEWVYVAYNDRTPKKCADINA
jgi:hypothetical protein